MSHNAVDDDVFREATVTWGTHVGAKSQNEMHIVEALQSREIGTVV